MKRLLLIAAATATVSASAAAEGIDFKYSGFGTIGGVITNADAGFRANLRQASGADKSVDYGVDSRIGLQGDVKFNDTFSAVGQLLSSRHLESDGLPVIEWLYGQANLPAGFKLKLGRVVLPVFLFSDSLAVGYTQFWQRTPIEVYQKSILTYINGGQLQYNGSLGPVSTTVQLSGGSVSSKLSYFGVGHLHYSGLKSLAVTAEYGDWLARFGTMRGHLSVLEYGLSVQDRFDDYALQYDNGTQVVIGEFVKRTAPALDSKAFYFTAGWRFGAWTPYLQSSAAPVSDSPRNYTQAVGLRWDVIKNVDIKVQAANVKGGAETFATPSPQFLASPPTVKVFSFGIDFVF